MAYDGCERKEKAMMLIRFITARPDAVGERLIPGMGLSGRDLYISQLRDGKISAVVEAFDLDLMQTYADTVCLGLSGP
jgi:hypothetical protein